MSLKIGIIGAGLSGLACALELEKNGCEVTVFDQSDQVGGRVKTDKVDGFILDHGFQVYLTSYEAGQYYFDYKSLNLSSFAPGACLVHQNQKSLMADPLRDPFKTLQTVFNPNATFKDKILILKLKKQASQTKGIDKKLNQTTTFDFLIKYGFSKKIIENFFQPFFAGVFLETQLKTPAGYFLYLFGKFGSGLASLPEGGMQDLALQLQKKLKKDVVFNFKATSISKNEIIFNNEEKFTFDHVILATDMSSLMKLGIHTSDKWNSVTTSYFKTKSNSCASKYLYLNTDSQKYVNHVACLTAAQPSYAPEGWQLYSVNCIGIDLSSESDTALLYDDLKKMFGEDEISQWQFIKSYYIKRALPHHSKYGDFDMSQNGVYLCGDYFESPSIQGALSSGNKLAKKLLAFDN